MLKLKGVLWTLLIALTVAVKVNAATSDNCNKVCFPDKIYSQCTANSRSLSLDEKKLCDQMTADCHSCTEGKKASVTQSQKPCDKVCNTEQLLNCHKKMDSLSIEEKAACSKMTADCQTCSEAKKAQIEKTQHPCNDICNTEKLLECHKNFETLTLEQKAFCTKMNEDCQDCPKS